MRFTATKLFILTLSITATISSAQTTSAQPQDPTTSSTGNCCACSDPPGGSSCCTNPNDFVGCIVKDNHCQCICFTADSKADSFEAQSDQALGVLLGATPSNATPEQRAELFKKIVTNTRKTKSYEVIVNDANMRVTLQLPKNWQYQPAVYERPSVYDRLFERQKFMPPAKLVITTTAAPPSQ